MGRGPYILKPTPITDAMLASCTVAEPAAGETAWTSAGTYALGDNCIRTTTHRIYQCILAHSGRTALPENDPLYWLDIGATQRWRMFDPIVNTQTTSTSDLTFVLRPGMFNAIALYVLEGASISVTVKDAPGGAVVFSYTDTLFEPFADWYEWLFSPYQVRRSLMLRDIVPYDTAELTITLTASGSDVRGVGMVVVGDLAPLIASGQWGSRYGISVEPIDYSYIKTDEYGNTRIVKRAATTGLEVEVIMPKDDVDHAVQLLQAVLATPVAFVATDVAGYQSTNIYGLVSGRVRYEDPTIGIANISVKGLI